MAAKVSTVGVIGLKTSILLDQQKQQRLKTQYKQPQEVAKIISDIKNILSTVDAFVSDEPLDDDKYELLYKLNGSYKTVHKYIELLRRFDVTAAKMYTAILSDQSKKLPIKPSKETDPRNVDDFGIIELEKDLQYELFELIKGLFSIIADKSKTYKLLIDFRSASDSIKSDKKYKRADNAYKKYGPLTGGQWKSLINIGGDKIIQYINDINNSPSADEKAVDRVVRRAVKFIKNYISVLRDHAASQPMSIWIINKQQYQNKCKVTIDQRYTGSINKKPLSKKPTLWDANEAAIYISDFVGGLTDEGYNIVQYGSATVEDDTLDIAGKLSTIADYDFAKFIVGSSSIVNRIINTFDVDKHMSDLIFGPNNENIGKPIAYKPEHIESDLKIPVTIPIRLTNWSAKHTRKANVKHTTFLDNLFDEIALAFKNNQLTMAELPRQWMRPSKPEAVERVKTKAQPPSKHIQYTHSTNYGNIFATFREFDTIEEIEHLIYIFIEHNKHFPKNYSLHSIKVKDNGNIDFIFKPPSSSPKLDRAMADATDRVLDKGEADYRQLRTAVRDDSRRRLNLHYQQAKTHYGNVLDATASIDSEAETDDEIDD